MKDAVRRWMEHIKLVKLVKKLDFKWKILAAVLLLCLIVLPIVFVQKNKKEPVYRELQVVRGDLTVGVMESGSISIGLAEQTLDLDISEYTGSSSSFSQGGGMMGENAAMGNMMQLFQGTANTMASGDTRVLEVEEVYISAGQQVEVGVPLLKLTDESVNSIRQKLEEDASDAQITYEQLAASQRLVSQQAQSEMDINKAYGSYMEGEYQKTVNQLEDSVESVQEQLTQEEEKLAQKQASLAELEILLAEYREVLANAEYARDYTNRDENLYGWLTAVNTVNDCKDVMQSLKEEMETATEEIQSLQANISALKTNLALANKKLKTGSIDAEATRKQRQFQYDNAQEIYDVTVGQSDFKAENAKEDYKEARQKLEEFDSVIVDGVISSSYSGIVTQTGISAGDSLEQDAVIITLSDFSDATISVTVDEEDMEAAAVGKEVNIFLAAYPDQNFRGQVTEIGDAEINSNTNTTVYTVTVGLTDQVERLYEGMTAQVTFITEETQEVLYISNRAITDGYVKVRDDNGKVVRRKVTTGFSDGIYTEIKEGLTEGETVLIESGTE